MRAMVLTEFGPPEVLQLQDVPEPRVGPDDVLVAVKASSVNPVDVKARSGINRAILSPPEPAILGLDVSGVVLEVGSRVEGFAPGDEVWSSPSHKRPGCYAERVAIDAAELSHKPTSLSHTDAASLPLVALTAWQCLLPRLSERSGQRVFVQAGSGGVGTAAIQIARHFDAWIATTCSPRNHELVHSLGADRAIDYRTEAFHEVLEPVDIVLDSLGGPAVHQALSITRRGGRLATITTRLPHHAEQRGHYLGLLPMVAELGGILFAGWRGGVQVAIVVKQCRGDQLAELAQLCDAGALEPVVEEVFPMTEVAAAHAHVATGHTRGKVALAGFEG